MIKKLRLLYICISFVAQTYSYLDNSGLFENKTILIIGGTGYLGRAIAGEILKYNPRKIIIFSRDEIKHFNITKIFDNNSKIQSVIGDIRDYQSLLKATRNVDIVFHAAALKRIDILESNVEEVIKTNILGTLNVHNACIANDVDKVLFISTDKACSPINTYGACKFIDEKIFTHYDKNKVSTKFMVVRFGNILESTGSVIPIFTEKIKNGEKIPLTDERMTRFIISKEEAVALIFDALRYGIGGEIFVKKLPALKIIDLVEILKDKFNAHNQIEIIGLRPGEKIHETLINESEIERTLQFQDFFIIKPVINNELDHHEKKPYFQLDTIVNKQLIDEYSSDKAVISKDALLVLFKKLGFL
ncbi:MAG: SDR family NAD(P)-dependent oxidoreductase [Candidatus Babeliaceae bacterium]